jgi:hypothetical protein
MGDFSIPMIKVGKLLITYREGGKDKHPIQWVREEDFKTLQTLMDSLANLRHVSTTLPDRGAATLSQFTQPLAIHGYKILPGVFPQSPRYIQIVREHKLRFWEIERAELVDLQEVQKP